MSQFSETTAHDARHNAPIFEWPSVGALHTLLTDERSRHDVRSPHRLPLQSLLVRRPASRRLVVHFHGSLDRARYELPRFERLSSLSKLDANVLLLADPTLNLDPDLRIAWYVGTAHDDVTQHYAELIRKFERELGTDELVIAGSSAGGFAAIACAPRLPHATVVAFSPQVNIGRFGSDWAERFRSAAFPEMPDYAAVEADATLRPRVDLAELFRRRRGGCVWYVQNSGDSSHVREQSGPFAAEVDERVTFIYEHHCTGHNPPTATRVVAWIEHALAAPESDPRAFALP